MSTYLTATDQFCGAGGTTTGATEAGVEVKLAINHWPVAIATHNSNYPNVAHDCADMSAVNPRRYQSTDFLISGPECTNHSLAKGKKRKTTPQLSMFEKAVVDPKEERSRATMWDVPRFAEVHKYNIIVVENVVDARLWQLWDAWLHAMDLLGYDRQIVYFNSMFAHPTPQSRDRMYIVFWRKGNKRPDLEFYPKGFCTHCQKEVQAIQVWKNRANPWGRYKKQYRYLCPTCANIVDPYYHCAAEAIDWTLPVPRIGDRAKPLKENTLKRIQAGLDKFSGPYLFDTVHTARNNRQQDMVWSVDGPGRTQIGNATHGLVTPPFVVDLAYTHSMSNRATGVSGVLPTQTGRQTQGLVVSPFVVNMQGESQATGIDDPLPTQLGTNHRWLCVPFLASYYGTNMGSSVVEPVPTVTTVDKHSLVVPFVVSYYTRESGTALASVDQPLPTQPTWPVHYLAQPGEKPTIEDCGFRMLEPHEIQKAMAFPAEYIMTGTKRQRVKQLGNAVTPPVMKMIIERCVESLQ
jgi:DNA (cytosine-5)-methyltransferase 1